MRFRRSAIALLSLAAVTGFWLFPILSRFSTAIPGTHAADNVTFVWNLWWMRYALHHQAQSFFFTPFLFYPIGADLTLHTHTALPALVAALVGPSSLVASQNLLIVTHLYLNFVCSYALAHRVTRRVLPAFTGSLIFGTSSFVPAHLSGHFNLIAAWTLPLVCLLVWRASEKASLTRGALAGAALAATAYIDYYLFIYASVLFGACWARRSLALSPRLPAPSLWRRRAFVVMGVLLSVDALLIVAIFVWHGDRIDIGSLHISVRSINNPITAAWILILTACASSARARIAITLRPDSTLRNSRVLIAIVTVTIVLLVPLLVHAAALWRQGGYVSQEYHWRSAPGGIDAATFVLGNPYQALWGEHVRGVYAAFHIEPIEQSAWIPIGALILAAVTIAARWREPRVQQLTIVGAVFMTWALGPWLIAFGRQTPLILPAVGVRYVPIIANLRMPGRAMIVVYLVTAMLATLGAAWLNARGRKARTACVCLVLLLGVECLPAGTPTYVADMPSQYANLRNRAPAGAVCELPLGIRDGFGEVGQFDSAVLLHQFMHERPIVGGFVARLPPAVARDYAAMPVIGSFLRLSSGGKLSEEPVAMSPREAASALSAAGIAFVVLDIRRASPDLIQYVQSRIALQNIGEEDGRIFYEVPEGRMP